MGVNYMILTMNPNQTIFDADTFIAETQRRWPGCQAYKKKSPTVSLMREQILIPQAHPHSWSTTLLIGT